MLSLAQGKRVTSGAASVCAGKFNMMNPAERNFLSWRKRFLGNLTAKDATVAEIGGAHLEHSARRS
jgi:hypothetical protein